LSRYNPVTKTRQWSRDEKTQVSCRLRWRISQLVSIKTHFWPEMNNWLNFYVFPQVVSIISEKDFSKELTAGKDMLQ
jgi:hypothetical protein